MIMESPFIQELVAKTDSKRMAKDIVTVLSKRLGAVPNDLRFQLESIADPDRLEHLIGEAATCVDLEAFRVAVCASNQRAQGS